jgi:ABC-type transport system involved in multi-copper enzyme maturation permease subunit
MNANVTTTNSDVSPASGGGPRVAPNQWRAFGGIWRLTAWQFLSRNHLLTVAGMTTLLAFICSRYSAPRSPVAYFEWVMEFFLTVVVPVLGFLSGAGAMHDQTKSSATDYVFTRPVRRWAFVGFKYVAHMLCTQLSWLPAFGVVVFFATVRGARDVGPAYSGVLLAQMLTLAAFVALGFLCAVLTKRYLIVGIVYAAIVEVGVGNIPAPLSGLSITRQMRELLEPIMHRVQASVSFADAVGTSGMIVLFCAVFVSVAALLFSLQELAGERAKD